MRYSGGGEQIPGQVQVGQIDRGRRVVGVPASGAEDHDGVRVEVVDAFLGVLVGAAAADQ